MRTSIATRIFAAFVVVGLTPLAVSVYALSRSRATAERLEVLRDGFVPLGEATTRALARVSHNATLLDRVVEETNPTVRHLVGPTFVDDISSTVQGAAQVVEAIRVRPGAAQDVQLFGGVGARLEEIGVVLDRYRAAAGTLESAFETGDTALARSTREALVHYNNKISLALRVISKVVQNRMSELTDEAHADESATVWAGAVMTALAFLIAAAVSLLAVRTLRPLRRLSEAARIVSKGEFSVDIPREGPGEIGALAAEFQTMADSLRERDERLAAERRFHANIVAGQEHAVVVVDEARRVRSINPAARTFFGLTDQVVGRTVSRTPVIGGLTEDTTRRALEGAFDRVFGGGPVEHLRELRYGERLANFNVAPLPEGQLLITARDVTDELRTKERLIQSERLAAVGRLAAQVAHEIRNPLSSIGLNVELLEDEMGDKKEVRDLLGAIQREVDRLADITEEYLRYARLPRPKLRRGELNAILRDLVSFLGEELRERAVALELELAGELPPVRADDRQLRQAFLNIMRNAAEAMPSGGRLRVSSRPVSQGVEVRFADNGNGIPAEDLDRVFQPFFSTKDGGTGLGLVVTRQIVEQHGGSVACESQPGKGTVMTVTLPAASEAVDAEAPPELEEARAWGSAPDVDDGEMEEHP